MGRADDLRPRLESYCSAQLGRDVTVTELSRFSGGASRETWSFTLDDGERLVLRLDPPGAPASSDRSAEVELLRRADAAGVPVPKVVWTPTADDIGSAGFVMEHVDGETIARKILRDDEYATARQRFATQCGEIAARIHTIAFEGIEGLDVPHRKPPDIVLDQYTELLDSLGEPHPALELAMRWLRTRMPASERLTVVHGDYRNGNFIVGPEGIRAVLDWELVHVGDPWEDLAWVCTRSWRFGGDGEAGGVGSRDDLYSAYERTSGIAVDAAAVHWWEVMSNVKWGVMTIVQAFTHLWGHVRSLELAAIGRRTVETEYDVLELIAHAR
jgi:aminoglycoside phosphotransferase (APT) family kinase protein